jgi:hypothetical protein
MTSPPGLLAKALLQRATLAPASIAAPARCGQCEDAESIGEGHKVVQPVGCGAPWSK